MPRHGRKTGKQDDTLAERLSTEKRVKEGWGGADRE